ncbi:hypothetical protein [Paenibacillus senegalensis]|uniref:hypothetical protein n=1 Tax=Paenibacillus senegalensis TaxID=1465766 RepID=UPI000289CE98|nr:hypothetical protein [Paenibacillus senegalensis]
MENLAEMNPVIYQANSATAQMLKKARDQVYHASRPYIQKPVRIQTIDGTIYEGVLVNLDQTHLYLSIPQPSMENRVIDYRQPYSYYNNVILPLVLYELLVITLLYT